MSNRHAATPVLSGDNADATADATVDATADADAMEVAGNLLGGVDQTAPPANAKERSKITAKPKNSSRTSLAERLENSAIARNPSASLNDDEVFIQGPHASSSGMSDTGSRMGDKMGFPSAYNVIRAGKATSLGAMRLGSLFGLGRVTTGEKIGFGRGGMAVLGDSRTFSAQNYHCAEKGLNMSFSLMKPPHGGQDGLHCLACQVPHSLSDRMAEEGLPIVVVLSDQNFPAVLPAVDGDCVVVIRVEDATLSDLETVFSERFQAFLRPYGNLTPGSVILIGSLSHLRACGLQDYTESLVKAFVSLSSKVGQGVEVVPLVGIPMHGIEPASLVRSLMDLDSWLMAVQGGARTVLNKTREVFWSELTSGIRSSVAPMESMIHMLPVGFRNHRKHPVVSDPYESPIPSAIPPVSEKTEKKILHSLLSELNDVFGLTLDVNPDTCREPDRTVGNSPAKTVTLGASHLHRVSRIMIDGGANVKSLCSPGWTPTRENLNAAAKLIAEQNLTAEDLFVVDLWSNSAFMGTDELGMASRSQKSNIDNKYHIVGKLQAAPRTLFEVILNEANCVLEAAGDAAIVVVAPLARYISGKCCDNVSHITNWGTETFQTEMYRAAERAEAVVASDSAWFKCKVFNQIETFGGSDLGLSEAVTSGGESVWRGDDPVHMTPGAYSDMASNICAMHEEVGEAQRPKKRPRLESVVPMYPRGTRGRQGQIQPPLWVTGLAPRPDIRGRGRVSVAGWRVGSGGAGGGRRGSGRGWSGQQPYRGRGRGFGYSPRGGFRRGGRRGY